MHCCLSLNRVPLDMEAWKCENLPSWHGFLDPVLKGLFQCCFWTQIAPFQNKKTLLHCVQSSPITCVSHCCTYSSQYSFFPPTPCRDSAALCFSRQPRGWWLHVSLCPRAALPGPSSLAWRIRRAETIGEMIQAESIIKFGELGIYQQEMNSLRETQIELKSWWMIKMWHVLWITVVISQVLKHCWTLSCLL